MQLGRCASLLNKTSRQGLGLKAKICTKTIKYTHMNDTNILNDRCKLYIK